MEPPGPGKVAGGCAPTPSSPRWRSMNPSYHWWRRMSHPDLDPELLRLGESRFVAHRRKELACFCERSVGA
jgi:hypothetical protein